MPCRGQWNMYHMIVSLAFVMPSCPQDSITLKAVFIIHIRKGLQETKISSLKKIKNIPITLLIVSSLVINCLKAKGICTGNKFILYS